MSFGFAKVPYLVICNPGRLHGNSRSRNISPSARKGLEIKIWRSCFVIWAACYRTEKARIRNPTKVPGRVLGRVPGKWGLMEGLLGAVPFLCFSKESGLPASLPAVLSAVLPAVPLFPALFPALSPAPLWDSGFLSPVAGGPDCKSCFAFAFVMERPEIPQDFRSHPLS